MPVNVLIISWGASIHETLQTARALEKEGISCEVIDVASIKPLDIDTILTSVEKTGRAVIVHEAHKSCGVGAEISAQIMENSLDALLAPVLRVTGYDVTIPYFKLEKNYLPSVARITESVHRILA